jgi:hypothetical protein
MFSLGWLFSGLRNAPDTRRQALPRRALPRFAAPSISQIAPRLGATYGRSARQRAAAFGSVSGKLFCEAPLCLSPCPTKRRFAKQLTRISVCRIRRFAKCFTRVPPVGATFKYGAASVARLLIESLCSPWSQQDPRATDASAVVYFE